MSTGVIKWTLTFARGTLETGLDLLKGDPNLDFYREFFPQTGEDIKDFFNEFTKTKQGRRMTQENPELIESAREMTENLSKIQQAEAEQIRRLPEFENFEAMRADCEFARTSAMNAYEEEFPKPKEPGAVSEDSYVDDVFKMSEWDKARTEAGEVAFKQEMNNATNSWGGRSASEVIGDMAQGVKRYSTNTRRAIETYKDTPVFEQGGRLSAQQAVKFNEQVDARCEVTAKNAEAVLEKQEQLIRDGEAGVPTEGEDGVEMGERYEASDQYEDLISEGAMQSEGLLDIVV